MFTVIEWKSVNDALPTEDALQLIAINDPRYGLGVNIGYMSKYNGNTVWSIDDYGCVGGGAVVTHWADMPKHPLDQTGETVNADIVNSGGLVSTRIHHGRWDGEVYGSGSQAPHKALDSVHG